MILRRIVNFCKLPPTVLRLRGSLADNFYSIIRFRRQTDTGRNFRTLCMKRLATMTTDNEEMATQLNALNALLEDPHPNDDDWSVDLLYTLESIYEIALYPDAPFSAGSRTNFSIAA